MIKLNGKSFIGSEIRGSGTSKFYGINPLNGQPLNQEYSKTTTSEIDKALELAENAFTKFKKVDNETKALFLEKIAIEIELLGDQLIKQYTLESGLPEGRAINERNRTCNQLKLFAELIREGSWVNARIDHSMKDRIPAPRPDLRSMELPIGPVVVFGASNFPLAFSVAGGDTASALAAGCPVVFKAHTAHLGTSELVGHAIISAAKSLSLPSGIFSLLFDDSFEVGENLVKHPLSKAVAFTGSQRGGLAIMKLANDRKTPIPVYAEMGSVNPVFLIGTEDKEKFAKDYIGSVNLGVGQFCTKPGLLFIQNDDELIELLKKSLEGKEPGLMLQPNLAKNYSTLISSSTAKTLAKGSESSNENIVQSLLKIISSGEFLSNKDFQEEIFGPFSLVIVCKNLKEFEEAAKILEGQLTASIHGNKDQLSSNSSLLDILTTKVGRILINGFPTGVEVSPAMVHGGPFPASSNDRTTSVGTLAIHRFTRQVCFQDFNDEQLPNELKENNPLGIWRLINGELKKA